MSKQVSAQRKTEQNNNAAPVSAQFQPRPFSPVAEIPVQRTPEELQKKQSGEQNPGYDLSREYAGGNSLFSLAPVQRQPEPTANTPDISSAPLLTGISGIQAKLTVGAVGDKYEQEADAVAARVVEQINSPQTQRQEGKEAIRRKPLLMGNVQREEMPEEEEIQRALVMQRAVGKEGGAVSEDIEAQINSARGSGHSLAPELQTKMGEAMGADFTGVRVHTDSQSDQLNKSIQAKAFTTGQDVFFRKGAYQPASRGGQELIAHELTHVVQQQSTGIMANRTLQHIQREFVKAEVRKKTSFRKSEKDADGARTVKQSAPFELMDKKHEVKEKEQILVDFGLSARTQEGIWYRAKTMDLKHEGWVRGSKIKSSIGLSKIFSISSDSKLTPINVDGNFATKKVTQPSMDDNTFVKFYTLLPGIKHSKVAQDFKTQDAENEFVNYDRLKNETCNKYLQHRDRFNDSFKTHLFKDEPDKTEKIMVNPQMALEKLDVMHPKTKAEGTLIKDLDKTNTDLNHEIANKLKDKDLTLSVSPDSQKVEHDGGIVGKHAEAFRRMLAERGSGDVLIRPAGEHAVKKLKENHPAKPLWIKGKSIDTSKLGKKGKTGTARSVLNRYLQKAANKGEDEAERVIDQLGEGLIPTNQILSKWFRDYDEAKIRELLNKQSSALENQEICEKINELVKETQKAIQEMLDTDLVKDKDGNISHPDPENGMEDKAAYTGDYDLYSISHRSSDKLKAEELSKLRHTRRSAGKSQTKYGQTYQESDVKDKGQDAYTPYAQQKVHKNEEPDPAKVHKLFGNISRFEMGMKIDLNSAAFKWGGYTGGQVIKHGAEARNFQFPQKISDGIVTIKPKGENKFDPNVKNEGKDIAQTDYDGKQTKATDENANPKTEPSHYVEGLLEQRTKLADDNFELPLNQKLLNAEKRKKEHKE